MDVNEFIDALKGNVASFTTPSASSAGTKVTDFDSVDFDAQAALKLAQTQRYLSDTQDRKWLAEWSTSVVSLWLFFILIILIANHDRLHLSDSVLNVLLGTTTLNILGLTYIVLRGHFNGNDGNKT